MNSKDIHMPTDTVNIEAVSLRSANVTRYVLARWRPSAHQSFVWCSQIVYKLAYSRRISTIIIIITLYQEIFV